MCDKDVHEILSENNQVQRIRNTVVRPACDWSFNTMRFLRHLEEHGLPVEHMEKIEGGKEIYTFVEAETVHPYKWTDEALYGVGVLLRRLHSASASFVPEDGMGCKDWCLREIGGDKRIWCHGDVAPWNMLTKGGMPYLLVDWEYSGPLDPIVELARVCWLFVQLHDDDLGALYGLPSPEDRARQVRLLCDGYGLERSGREGLAERIIEVIICETAHEAIDEGLTFESRGSLWGFAWRTRSLYWVWRNKKVLSEALNKQ